MDDRATRRSPAERLRIAERRAARDQRWADRPDHVFDPMMQHERTALAWERTAIADMVVGTIFARYARELHWGLALIGIVQVMIGGAVLIWTGVRYESLHGPLRRGESPVHPTAARVVGASSVAFIGIALVIALIAR